MKYIDTLWQIYLQSNNINNEQYDKERFKNHIYGNPRVCCGIPQAPCRGRLQCGGCGYAADKPVGRHQDTLQPSQVKLYAVEHGLPVLQPVKMKDPEFLEQLKSYQADLQVVVAFRMLPEVVWAMPKFGTFNVHAALLPQYRGAAPINWAVINGETETGVTTFFLDHDIDTGRIIMQKRFPIPDEANVEYVYDGLMHLGAEIALETIDQLIASDGNISSIAQEEFIGEGIELKSAPKIFKDTCCIDFHKPAKRVHDFIRGLSPYPGAWTYIKKKDAVKEQVLKISRLQLAKTREVWHL